MLIFHIKEQAVPKKYYVIPVDSDGFAYFGVKSDRYNDAYYSGMPNVLGGTKERTPSISIMYPDIPEALETIINEAAQESHNKLMISWRAKLIEIHSYNGPRQSDDGELTGAGIWDMKFYIINSVDFIYMPDNKLAKNFLNLREYNETTGQMLKINLAEIARKDESQIAFHLVHLLAPQQPMRYVGANASRMKGFLQLIKSPMVTALRKAADYWVDH